MKKVLTITLLMLVFSNYALAEVETHYYDNGQKRSEENLKEGKWHGLNTVWYKNGQKSSERNYKEGKRHGSHTVWYKNGQKSSEENFKEEKRHGSHTVWDENGQKGFERNYKEDAQHGSATEWYENRQKSGEYNYKEGESHGLNTTWDENGQKIFEECYSYGDKVDMSNCVGSNKITTNQPKTTSHNADTYANLDWWKSATLGQVKQSIADGLNVNELFGNDKGTVLHLATANNNPKVIEYLIKSGANINAKDKYGNTPLYYAKYRKNNKALDSLKTMSKRARYKYFPVASSCITIVKKNNIRFPRNDCNFPVAMWFCYEGYVEGDTNAHECNTVRHFSGLKHMEANSSGGFFPFSRGYTIGHIICGDSGEKQYVLHITNDKKGATKFGCRKTVYE